MIATVLAWLFFVVVLALGALMLIGWAYNLGKRDGEKEGRRLQREEIVPLILSCEFAEELEQELQKVRDRRYRMQTGHDWSQLS